MIRSLLFLLEIMHIANPNRPLFQAIYKLGSIARPQSDQLLVISSNHVFFCNIKRRTAVMSIMILAIILPIIGCIKMTLAI